ncbi:hypothetical protein D3C73_1110650 [compost metagenome]
MPVILAAMLLFDRLAKGLADLLHPLAIRLLDRERIAGRPHLEQHALLSGGKILQRLSVADPDDNPRFEVFERQIAFDREIEQAG